MLGDLCLWCLHMARQDLIWLSSLILRVKKVNHCTNMIKTSCNCIAYSVQEQNRKGKMTWYRNNSELEYKNLS